MEDEIKPKQIVIDDPARKKKNKLKIVLPILAVIVVAVLNGICGVILSSFNKMVWNRHRLVTGMVLSILAVLVFIAARQPYAGIVCFAFLVIKGILIVKVKQKQDI